MCKSSVVLYFNLVINDYVYRFARQQPSEVGLGTIKILGSIFKIDSFAFSLDSRKIIFKESKSLMFNRKY